MPAPRLAQLVGSTCNGGPAIISAVTDDPLPADLDHIRVALERTHAVGRRLIGLQVDDARKRATQSHRHFRVVTNPIMTAELDMRRVNVRTEDDIVVDFSTGCARPPRPPVTHRVPRRRTALGAVPQGELTSGGTASERALDAHNLLTGRCRTRRNGAVPAEPDRTKSPAQTAYPGIHRYPPIRVSLT